MDDPDFSISERLHQLLPPALDEPARQRDLRTVAWLVDQRFDHVNRRFDQVDRRFDEVGRRFDKIERKFDDINQQFVELRNEFKASSLDLKSTIFKLFVAFFGTTITAVLGALAILANVVK